MYGFFKAKINPELRREFSPAYCGVCESICYFSGKRGRFLSSFDGAAPLFFLMRKDKFETQPRRCYFRMVNPLDVIGPWEEKSLFLGAITLFYLHINLQDKIQDNEGMALRFLHSWQKKGIEKATTYLKEKWNFPLNKYDEFLEEQKKKEQQNEKDWDVLADVSKKSFSTVYSFLDKTAEWKKVGELHGELVYFWDALLDYHKDIKKQQFNPLIYQSEEWIKKKFHSMFFNLQKLLLKITSDDRITESFISYHYSEKEKILQKWKK
jgi:hypothetical protein